MGILFMSMRDDHKWTKRPVTDKSDDSDKTTKIGQPHLESLCFEFTFVLPCE